MNFHNTRIIVSTYHVSNNRKRDKEGLGAIQVLRNAYGGVTFSGKKRYEGVRFNVISVTRGWVGVQFPEKSVT